VANTIFGRDGSVGWAAFGGTMSARIKGWTLRRRRVSVDATPFKAINAPEYEDGEEECTGTIIVIADRRDTPPPTGVRSTVLTLKTAAAVPYQQHSGSAFLEELSHDRRGESSNKGDEQVYTFKSCGSPWPDPLLVTE